MKQPRYLKASNLPPRVNVLVPLLWVLVLERFDAPGWIYGVIFTMLGIIYAGEIYRLFAGKAVDIFEEPK